MITKINEMGGRMKLVWLLPFKDLVGFFFTLDLFTACDDGGEKYS